MKLSHFIILIILAVAMNSCYKDDNTSPEYLKKMESFGGDNLDFARKIVKTDEGNYLLLGETESFGSGKTDVYLVKLDDQGNMLWENFYGGSDDEEAKDIITHPNGYYYIAGSTNSYGSGGADMMLIKVNSDGEQISLETFGNKFYDKAFFLTLSTDNNIILGGYVRDAETQVKNSNIRKLTTDGEEVWSESFGGDSTYIATNGVDTEDGLFITGRAVISDNNEDIFMLKMEMQGNRLWQKNYGDAGMEQASDFVLTSNGNFVLCGFSGAHGDNSNNDLFLMELTKQGDSISSTHFGDTNEWDYEEGYAIIKNSRGGYYISGRSKDAMMLAKATMNLEVTGVATYGSEFFSQTAIGYDLIEKNPQTIIVVGGHPNSTNSDMLYLEIDPEKMD